MVGVAIAADPAVTAIAGRPIRTAIFAVPVAAVAASATISGRRTTAYRGEEQVRAGTARGIDIHTGECLRIGDTVRAGAGFDGPMELAFGRGVIVKVGRGKAHVRFNDVRERVRPVTPATPRRLAQGKSGGPPASRGRMIADTETVCGLFGHGPNR